MLIYAYCTSVLIGVSTGVVNLTGAQDNFSEEVALYELIRAAQARNLDSPEYDEGRIAFTVEYQPPSSDRFGSFRPVRLRGRLTWRGRNGLWFFQAQDPDKYCFGVDLIEEVENAPKQYQLIIGSKVHAYNNNTNVLYIKPYNGSTATSFLLDVMPLSNWFRCCPPNHEDGRPWIEMIGPSAPVMSPGDSMSIVRDGQLIHQTRTLDVGGTVTTTFSLQWDGNVVRNHFTGAGQRVKSSLVTYEWGRDRSGSCVLKRCEAKEFEPGSDTEVRRSYTLTIDSVDLERPVRASEISFAAFLSMLPHDVLVKDSVSNKQYYPNPGVNPSRLRFDRLAEVIANEGFLDKD